jgi:DNA-binding XRE family transcriptional regulator
VLKLIDDLDNEASQLLDLISTNVVKARKEKGYSQLKLATEIGYSCASYVIVGLGLCPKNPKFDIPPTLKNNLIRFTIKKFNDLFNYLSNSKLCSNFLVYV